MSNLRMVSAYSTDHEARKCGTDVPHEPTDEFVRQSFANGAGSLWPDGRDPGWLATFDRWLEAREAAARREALLEAADAYYALGRRFNPTTGEPECQCVQGDNDRPCYCDAQEWLRARALADDVTQRPDVAHEEGGR